MRRLNYELAHGEILDVGLEHYGEFIVSVRFGAELLAGGMRRVDDRPGSLRVIEWFENAVQLRWVYDGAAAAAVQPQLRAAA